MKRLARPGLKSLLLGFLLLAFLLGSCSPLYIMRAAWEEGRILWRRQPIEMMLQDPGLNAETKEKLKLVLDVREYARDTLKFKVGGSYSTYSYVDRPAVTYVLMAVPKTALEPYSWSFLIVGKVPYKGFFSEDDAKAEAASFEAEGYDTHIRRAGAFSTLGWFDDPLLSHLLGYDKVALAEIIFHELLHQTLFVKGAVDFNESLANFVANQAAIRFFRELKGAASAEYRQAVQTWKDELEFSKFLGGVAGSLRELYATALPEEEKLKLRQEIFARSRKEWSLRTAERPAHRHRGYSQQKEINNAVIAQYLLYLKDFELFEALYRAEGEDLPRLVGAVREAAAQNGNPFESVRAQLRRKTPA